MRLLHCCGLKLACSHAVGAPATGGAAAQANPSLVMSGGVAVAAAPITGYVKLALTDVTDSAFVMSGIPGNRVPPPAPAAGTTGRSKLRSAVRHSASIPAPHHALPTPRTRAPAHVRVRCSASARPKRSLPFPANSATKPYVTLWHTCADHDPAAAADDVPARQRVRVPAPGWLADQRLERIRGRHLRRHACVDHGAYPKPACPPLCRRRRWACAAPCGSCAL